MAEQTSKPNFGLYNKALQKAINNHNMFLIDALKCMNPGRLSQSDIDTLSDIIEDA
jgi:hypothetical protein